MLDILYVQLEHHWEPLTIVKSTNKNMNYICSKKTTLYWIVSRQHLMCCFKSVATIWHLFNAKIVYDYIIIPKYCVEIPFWLRRTTFSRIFTWHVNLSIYMYVAAVSLVATLTKCRSASPALSLSLFAIVALGFLPAANIPCLFRRTKVQLPAEFNSSMLKDQKPGRGRFMHA